MLNMKELSDFNEHGCSEILKLRDVCRDCEEMPINCYNGMCQCNVPIKEDEEREARVNGMMTSRDGENRRDSTLSSKIDKNDEHHISNVCLSVTEQNQIIDNLKAYIENIKNAFRFRERFLVSKITSLKRDLQMQAVEFQNQMRNYQNESSGARISCVHEVSFGPAN